MDHLKIWGGCFVLALSAILSGCTEENVISRRMQFQPPQTGVITAMTFNIRVDTILDVGNGWGKRKQLAIDTIATNTADIVGLQEALDRQVRDIRQALPQYNTYSAGRSNGKQKGESCAILYRKDRFTLNDSGTFWFSKNPSKPGSKSWGAMCPRICSWVNLSDIATGKRFYVYNVHLDNLSQSSRKNSTEILARHIAARRTLDPFFVMGDFNMQLDNPAMRYLQKIGFDTPYPKMTDAWQSLNPSREPTGTRHGFSGRTSGPRIDHIPVSEGIRTLAVKTDTTNKNGKYPSDHFPVIAKFLLPEPAKLTVQNTTTRGTKTTPKL